MTLIAHFHPKGGCAILADLLASNPQGDPDFTPPTRAHLSSEEINKMAEKPHSLWRKIIEVNEDLAIICAGNSSEAAKLARRAREWFSKELVTKASVDDFLDARYSEYIPDFCAILAPSRHNWVRVVGTIPAKRAPFAGDYLVAGTGSPVFDWLVTNFIPRTSSQIAPDIDALRVASELLAREINFGETLKRKFGAGFEVLYTDQNGWTKVDDVMHMFGNIIVNNDPNLQVQFYPHVLRQWYEDDRLYIASLSTPEAEAFGLKYRGYVATDVERTRKPSERVLGLRPNYLCIHYAFWFDGQAFPSALVAKGEDIDRIVALGKTDTKFEMSFTRYHDQLLSDRLSTIKTVRSDGINSPP